MAFYVSGQFLTEDYYAANKLMKGFIGSGNIDTNSRLCMASSVAGHVRAFGEDVVPGVYEDWEAADLVVLVGSNTAWCHPVLHQRLQAAKRARGTQIVVLDPRRTATAEMADLHLPLAPGTDVILFQGLLAYLDEAGALDRAWVARHATGLEDALAAARRDAPSPEAVAEECGVDPEAVETFYALFARTERVLTAFSQGVNQSSAGTDKCNAIINCHLATGRIGRAGMGPFSLTGQPNAMGGREVGGLANQLAAHMRWDDLGEVEALRRFWGAPSLAAKPGLKAVELFDAVLDGQVKALWIAATNPAASLPRADRVRAALAACPFVVVSDCWETDTTEHAQVLLPAAAWGEKSGTVTSSERRISRQRPFRSAPGEARPDWWMFAEVGRRMGWPEAFAWADPAAVFREHAAVSGLANAGRRLFDISALAALDDAAYDALDPVRWPCPAGGAAEGGRLFGQGGFPTPDGRARIVPTPYRGRPDARRTAVPAQYRPRARPVAHDDADGPGSGADGAHAGAGALDQSGRCRPARPRLGRAGAGRDGGGGAGAPRRADPRAAARRGVRADALDGPVRAVRPRRPRRGCPARSRLGPTGAESDACAGERGRGCLARAAAQAPGRASRRCLPLDAHAR